MLDLDKERYLKRRGWYRDKIRGIGKKVWVHRAMLQVHTLKSAYEIQMAREGKDPEQKN